MNTTKQLISLQRAKDIIECYGGNAKDWPDNEREALSALVQQSEELQASCRDAKMLDDMLLEGKCNEAPVTSDAVLQLQDRIMSELPETDRRFNKIRIKGAIAASIVAVLFSFSLFFQSPTQQHNAEVSQAFNSWAWDEVDGEPDADSNVSEDEDIFPLVSLAEPDLLS